MCRVTDRRTGREQTDPQVEPERYGGDGDPLHRDTLQLAPLKAADRGVRETDDPTENPLTQTGP